MSIDLEHSIVKRLKKSIKENPGSFIAVVGAGISRQAGIPNWQGLKEVLVEEAKGRVSEYRDAEKDGYLAKLERINAEGDYWRSFEELKTILGKPHYEYCIKQQLQGKEDIPENYNLLWRLNISGIITFNLDTFASDSFAEVNRRTPDHATGRQPSRYSSFLTSGNKFVFQPHGTISDSESWVFTKRELEELIKNTNYIDFIKRVFHGRSSVVLGLNTEDFSLQYTFTKIIDEFGKLTSPHYALVSDPPIEMIKEYSEKNIFIIPYSPERDDHQEINCLLKSFLDYTPQEKNVGSVYEPIGGDTENLSPAELEKLPVNRIRQALNEKVAKIISPHSVPTEKDLQKLADFYREFVMPIHKSWLVQPDTDYSEVFGHIATRRVGKGAFGQVFEAEDIETKGRVAIKLLLPELRDHKDYLNSFRRGVRSMRILTEKKIPGMVKFKAAYEVPACIVMEYIDGPTLRDASNQGYFNDIHVALDVLRQIGSIVKKGHDLDELVLHRDLKPENIILKDYYGKDFDINVVVLDFDLSWHKGALDLSIVDGARAQGYAAPEQTASFKRDAVSTRHTAVDVFGFGMVAFFVLTGADPRPNEQNFKDFKNGIQQLIEERYHPKQISLPEFLADLICKCTYDDQSSRISFDSAIDSIQLAFDICNSNKIPAGHPLLLLEITSQIGKAGTFQFSDYNRKIRATYIDKSKPMEIQIIDKNMEKYLSVKIEKVRGEFDDRNIGKYLDNAKHRSISQLRDGGFLNINASIGQSFIVLTADYKVDEYISLSEIKTLADTISDVRSCLDLR